ncbi:MAG: hypothetical protein ACOYYJ_19400 [Chloroflexota bacterium]
MNEAEIVRGIRVSRDGSRLVVRWKRLARNVNGCGDWAKEAGFFVVGLALFIFPAVGLASRALQGGASAFGLGDLVSLPFLLVGGLLVYRALTIMFNTELIEVTRDQVKVRSLPLPPWDMETISLPLRDIASVECQVKLLRSNRRDRRGVTHNYNVNAVMRDGKVKGIITGSTAQEPAHYVAREITNFIEAVR